MLALQEGNSGGETCSTPIISITIPWNSLLLKGLHHLDTLQISDESRHFNLLSLLMNIKGVRKYGHYQSGRKCFGQ